MEGWLNAEFSTAGCIFCFSLFLNFESARSCYSSTDQYWIYIADQSPSQPPDLTSNTSNTPQSERVNRYNPSHAQSVRVSAGGAVTGLDTDSGTSFFLFRIWPELLLFTLWLRLAD